MSPIIFTQQDWHQDPSTGLILPRTQKRYPRAFDFFAGCGGFSLGLIKAGYEVVGAMDISHEAAHTYVANLGCWPMQFHYTSDEYRKKFSTYLEKRVFKPAAKRGVINLTTGHVSDPGVLADYGLPGTAWINTERLMGNHYPPVRNFWLGDIRQITGEQILEKLGMKRGELDLIVGGPPCQGYSSANQSKPRGAWDPRNDLVFHYARLLVELSPVTFVMEEVPDILNYYTPHGVPVIEQFLRILSEGGYGDFQKLCEAMNYAPKGSRVVYRDTDGKGKTAKPKPDAAATKQASLF